MIRMKALMIKINKKKKTCLFSEGNEKKYITFFVNLLQLAKLSWLIEEIFIDDQVFEINHKLKN